MRRNTLFDNNQCDRKIFSGKYREYKNRTVIQLKDKGVEAGAIVSYSKTNPDKESESTIFLEKIVLNPIQEKIYLDIARYFSSAATSRLAILPTHEATRICRDFETKKNVGLYESLPENEACRIINDLIERDVNNCPSTDDGKIVLHSKMISGYADLADCRAIDDDLEEYDFITFIEKYGRFPEIIKHPHCHHEIVRLEGLLTIAANAKLTGDIDWLGGSARNTGAVLVYGEYGMYAKAINVDAGFATNNKGELNPTQAIRYASACEHDIELTSLGSYHYQEYMHALYLFAYRYSEKEDDKLTALLEYLVNRNNAFNEEGKLLYATEVDEIISKLKFNIQMIKTMYHDELQDYAIEFKEELDLALQQARKKDEKLIEEVATYRVTQSHFTIFKCVVSAAAIVVAGASLVYSIAK
jgi:hypothetical protein